MYESLEKVLDPTAEFIYKQIPGKGWILNSQKSSIVQKGKDIEKQIQTDPPKCDVVDSVVADGSNDQASLGGEHWKGTFS